MTGLPSNLSRKEAALAGGAGAALLTALAFAVKRIASRYAWKRKTRNAPVLVRDQLVSKHDETASPEGSTAGLEMRADAPRH